MAESWRNVCSPEQLRPLGNSGFDLSPVGVGTWAFGGAFGPQGREASVRTLHAAFDLGINWVDTAPIYGKGEAETVVGEALRGRHGPIKVFSKCGCCWDDQRDFFHCLKADSIRREVEASLRRLKVEQIDLYQIHWPNPEADLGEAWETMLQLQEAGKIGALGVSNFWPPLLERLRAIAPVASVQPSYSLLFRRHEEALADYCERHRIGVIAYSPLGSGMLTGRMTRERVAGLPEDDWRRKAPSFQEPAISRSLAAVECSRNLADSLGISVGAVAIGWVLRRPELTGAIVGMRSPKQVELAAEVFATDWRSVDWDALESRIAEAQAPFGSGN